ncbi:MAG: LysR family transcriptional regulator [Aliidongia sp.]
MSRVAMERSGEMEVFVRVVQDGGFSAAARSLDLTPSAVSKLIARLETRLGARLLLRTTRALTLTDEGQSYLRAALRVLQDLNEAEQAVGTGAIRGRLVVNASLPFGTHVVAPALPAFLARYPIWWSISASPMTWSTCSRRRRMWRCASARCRTAPSSPASSARAGGVICAAPAYLARNGTPGVPDELQHHNCLTFNFRRSRIGWPFREKGRDREIPVTGSVQINNGETMRQMVLAGLGIARLGRWHVAHEIERGDLVPLFERYNPGDLELINAVYVGGGQIPRRVRAFIDYMAEIVGASSLFAA